MFNGPMECEAPMLALLDAPFLSIVHCLYLLFFKREAQEPLVLYILELKETKPSSLVEHFAKGIRFKSVSRRTFSGVNFWCRTCSNHGGFCQFQA